MSRFRRLFGFDPKFTAEAPGRVNLIGEHTDYNGGFVLPAAIPQRTRVELLPRNDNVVRAASSNKAASVDNYTLGTEKPGRGWLDYVQGITHLLHAEGFALKGFDLWIKSDVPLGSGLSSSASLGISILRALRDAFDLRMDDVEMAQLTRRSENEFVGARVGIMDPMACALAQPGHALFLDARDMRFEQVPLPASAELAVINSGLAHQHAAGDYNTRRAECEEACRLLGVPQLRDVDMKDLPRIESLPEPFRKRARDVITENQRVLDAVAALRANDLQRLGSLFYESHDSQSKDYEVSIPQIDLLVNLARQEPDVFGARLTGGGFGGSVVMLVCEGKAKEAAKRIATAYAAQTGQTATVLVP